MPLENEPGATPDPKTEEETPKADEEQFPAGLGDAGKEAIRKEREARAEADKAATAANKELAALRKEKADAAAAKAKADEEEATKRGEFEKLASERAEALQAAKAETATLTERLAAYETALAPVVDAIKAELPAEALKDYPKDAEAVDRLSWLNDRKALLADLKVGTNGNVVRMPITPEAKGGGALIKPLVSKQEAGYG